MSEVSERSAVSGGKRSRRVLFVLGGVAVLAGIVVAVGLRARSEAGQRLASWTAAQLVPTVTVVRPSQMDAAGSLILPGTLQALNSAPINARADGYVRQWFVDLGDRVKTGQLLALIDTPELDRQLAQAEADLRAAQENEALAQKTNTRWQALVREGWVSHQDADQRESDWASKRALSSSALAQVQRLAALAGFKRIEAPFDGTVTSRATQVGQLVSAGVGGTPLFTISDTSRIRIYVRVPQAYSGRLAPGAKASLSLPEFPSRSFDAVLVRSADAVDQQSGTVLVEFQAANPDGALKPGAYAQVKFAVPNVGSTVRIPASAVLYRSDGVRVAVVDGGQHVHLRSIKIGEDDGDTLQVVSGLTPTDQVIDSPPDAIGDGDPVKPTAPPPKPKA